MKAYVVGGAVRDSLLGLPVQDRDHVVVGATPEQMLALGFTAVGKDFPVFLHPHTHEEYALARTERKTAPGYKGFVFHAAPDVTLDEDLVRRDLTINAMAQDDDGTIIDPFGGQQDLQARLFRHVSPAFAEDPVRILRVARFAARFADFFVAPETVALMCAMVDAGEVDALVPERVWQELSRGLLEQKPSRMFAVLGQCGALARILPEMNAAWHARQQDATASPDDGGMTCVMRALDHAARQDEPLPVRFAVLAHALAPRAAASDAPLANASTGTAIRQVEQSCARLKVPNDCRDLALILVRESAWLSNMRNAGAADMVTMIERCDGIRKPQRFAELLRAMICVQSGSGRAEDAARADADYLAQALTAARSVNAGAIAQQYAGHAQRIAAAVRSARIAAVAAALPDI